MSAESTLYSILSTAAGVTALVSTRIYPDLVPEEKATPYIGYERVSGEQITTLSGDRLGELGGFTVACWAETRLDAEAVANSIITALTGSEFSLLARGSEVDEETGRLAATLDYQILTT